ncbi:MAG: Uma2 family endonuclease [Anaerolineae bacterium]|nr:Uma2 family endonuclease [Anaerolineae bacterium]
MTAQPKIAVRFDEYAAMPETNQIVELIDGEIIMNPPNFRHQRLLWLMIETLMPLMKEGVACLAPTGLHIDDLNSFEPDLFWVRPDSTDCVLEASERFWYGTPDLVIEVLSPSTAPDDRGVKFEAYQKAGVREYWLVDPEAKYTEVYQLKDGKFERQGVFKPAQPFVSAALNGATIDHRAWFGG